MPVRLPASSSKEKLERAPTSKSTAELYGFKSQSDLPEVAVSQHTISDTASQPEVAAQAAVAEACERSYFDFDAMCLVCFFKNGRSEMAKMKAGENGFAMAVFRDGFEKEQTVANLEFFGTA